MLPPPGRPKLRRQVGDRGLLVHLTLAVTHPGGLRHVRQPAVVGVLDLLGLQVAPVGGTGAASAVMGAAFDPSFA